jgi:hypothetical protein
MHPWYDGTHPDRNRGSADNRKHPGEARVDDDPKLADFPRAAPDRQPRYLVEECTLFADRRLCVPALRRVCRFATGRS